jgi:hypothetical protein
LCFCFFKNDLNRCGGLPFPPYLAAVFFVTPLIPSVTGLRIGQLTGLANHNLLDPHGLYAMDAPIKYLPPTFCYCYPATVLEWHSGHGQSMPPVTKLFPFVTHLPAPGRNVTRPRRSHTGVIVSLN